MSLLVVDAENVRRSVWPNVELDELVALCARHGEEAGVDVVVALDGPATRAGAPGSVRLLAEPGRSADDVIVELLAGLAPGAVTVATSDRGLRARLEGRGVSFVGGGGFVRELLRHR
jgi:rRNA-processing protein FCF1